jgi:hypothetical protein
MSRKKPNRPQKGKSQDKGRRPTSKRSKLSLSRQTPSISDDLKGYLKTAAAEGDVTLEDARRRLFDLDEATIGEFLGDYFSGFDLRHDGISDDLDALIEQVGDQTTIKDVLPGG